MQTMQDSNQRAQIWRFLNVLVTNFLSKVAQIFGVFLAIFQTIITIFTTNYFEKCPSSIPTLLGFEPTSFSM